MRVEWGENLFSSLMTLKKILQAWSIWVKNRREGGDKYTSIDSVISNPDISLASIECIEIS